MQADDSSDGDNDDDSDGAVEESVGTGNGSDDRAIADLERKAAEMAIAARLRKDNHTSSVGDISHHRASQEDGPPSGRRNNFGTRLTSEIMKHREIAAILGDDDSSEPSNNSGKANESKTSGIAAKRAQRPPVAGDPNQRQGPPSKIPQPGWARQALLAAQQRRASGGVLGIGGEGANSSDSTSEASDKPMARMPASSNGDHTLVSDLKQAMSSVSFGSSFPTVKENQPARMSVSQPQRESSWDLAGIAGVGLGLVSGSRFGQRSFHGVWQLLALCAWGLLPHLCCSHGCWGGPGGTAQPDRKTTRWQRKQSSRRSTCRRCWRKRARQHGSVALRVLRSGRLVYHSR
mmetsp:Transcript_33876/g.52772  ORF Transcript_33876/g.52772 Transcript_33876/m.52772 type:complete len:347 (+) Transcript_33876:2328-3368(+)